MPIPRNIKQYLFHNHVNYAQRRHPVAYTSQEIAQMEGIPGAMFAKTVILKADEGYVMAVVPADHVIDIEGLRTQVGWAHLALASEREFSEKFPSCEAGAMPPFGKFYGMPVYCDAALAEEHEIEFNAGTHIDTIRITFSSFAKLENPLMLRFSEKPKTQRAARSA